MSATTTDPSRRDAPASCDDDYDPASLSCEQALARLLEAVTPIEGSERVHLRAALGRVLAAPVVARCDVPAHTNSAMDGYAINAEDLPPSGTAELPVVGASFAGKPYRARLARGTAVRIMTGAVVPEGADTILIQERVEERDGRIRFDAHHERGQHVRHAGEDLKAGAEAFTPGRRVSAADLGVIASLGIGELTVLRRPRIAFFSTGDELRSLGEPLGLGEIYDSNRYTLHGMLSTLGVELVDLGVVADDPASLEAAFRVAARDADAVITSGGVSVGEADYTREILARLGEVRFWKVAMKPGRPLAFGKLGRAWFFGLPGNPVSVMVTFYEFVRPALDQLAGTAPRLPWTATARVTRALKKRPGRVEFQRGRLTRAADGTLEVTPTGEQGSGILSSMSQANCLIVLGLETTRIDAGSPVEVQPFEGLL
ncbi:MAG TPA: molybdopterin molybdotransferase MoeA [Gammaproteobacteria bacterium]|nr:molybdopterin molybdotransferase MoeA [Gammaproteobacteria bacterium]